MTERLKTYPWDILTYLDSDEAIEAYLDAALEEDDPQLLVAVLGDIARAKGMSEVAREAGLGRESLYKSLSLKGNPEFRTVHRVIRALGLQLRVTSCASPTTPSPAPSGSPDRSDPRS